MYLAIHKYVVFVCMCIHVYVVYVCGYMLNERMVEEQISENIYTSKLLVLKNHSHLHGKSNWPGGE